MSPDPDRKQRIADAWRSAWDEGDVDALDTLLGPDYVRHGRSGDQNCAALKAAITGSREAFPDLITTIDGLISEDNLVAIRWHSSGTHLGTFQDVPATHRTVTVDGVTTARFDGVLIVEDWVTWDPVDLFSSLGIISLREIE